MSFKGIATRATVIGIAIAACFALAAPGTSAKQSKPPLVWIDMYGQTEKHPDFVFFTANSGGQVHSLKWSGWGKRKAVGRGIYRDTSASYPGKPDLEGPARIVVWKPIKCVLAFGDSQGKTFRIYRHARMLRSDSRGGRKWINLDGYTGLGACK